MKGYKTVYDSLNNSKAVKNSYGSHHNKSSGFYTSDRDIKNKREELIRKYSNSSKEK
jgi:hypothetical protein